METTTEYNVTEIHTERRMWHPPMETWHRTSYGENYAVVNGERWDHWAPTIEESGGSHSRRMFRSPDRTRILKVETGYCEQNRREWQLWSQDISEHDKCYFTELFAYGEVVMPSFTYDGQPCDIRHSYVVAELLQDYELGEVFPRDLREIFDELIVSEYGIGDWNHRQFKLVNGSPKIHDFGF